MKPLISIIVPMFNIEMELGICLQSISVQTYENLEIILVDDASTDSTLDLAREFCKDDSRFKLFSLNETLGAGAVRNYGIKKATGDYICFIDGDDWVLPYYVENLWIGLSHSGADISIGQISRNLKLEESLLGAENIQLLPVSEALKQLFLHQIPSGFPSKLFPQKIVKDLLISESRYFEDTDWFYRLLLGLKTVALVDSMDYHYYLREDSLSSRPYTEEQLSILEIGRECMDTISKYYPSLLPYAAFFAWGHLRYHLVDKAAYIGTCERPFFKAARKYCLQAWTVANRHLRIWMLTMLMGYPVFWIFRFCYPMILGTYLGVKGAFRSVLQIRKKRSE